jgi:tRNA/rRNA methyltransferase
MLNFYVYVLKCADDSYYVGHTDNLEKRIAEHSVKKFSGYTSTRLPIVLAFAQQFSSRYEALVAERKIKKWTRKKKEILALYGWEGFIKLKEDKKAVKQCKLSDN